MSLLDDARRLAGVWPTDRYDNCVFCYEIQRSDEPTHAPDCPWLAMPQIVAALEAAERLVESNELIVEGEGTWKLHCLSCEAVQDDWTPFDPKPFLHTPKCLITAMEVGVAPQESEKPTS